MDILEMERSALVILGLFTCNYTLSISFGRDVTPLYLLALQMTFSKPHNTRSLPLKCLKMLLRMCESGECVVWNSKKENVL